MNNISKVLILLMVNTSISYSVDYYVVYHADLSGSWVQQFYDWKTSQGYDVLLESVSDGTKEDIKNMIEVYANSLKYVLLVGDANELPANQQDDISSANGNFIPLDYQAYEGFDFSSQWHTLH
ncbi:MAG: C25 family cysteine peptidase [Fidelibacterota bacterium]